MKNPKHIHPSKSDILINTTLDTYDEELRFFHKILIIWERHKKNLKTKRFDNKRISELLKNSNIITPHDTKNNKIWIENSQFNAVQFKGSGNIGIRLTRFIRNSYAHNQLEKIKDNSGVEYIHLQTWNISRRINDGKPYCNFDLCLRFQDLSDIMQIILDKYLSKE